MEQENQAIDTRLAAAESVTDQIQELYDLAEEKHADIMAIFPRVVMVLYTMHDELCEYKLVGGVRESYERVIHAMLCGKGERKRG